MFLNMCPEDNDAFVYYTWKIPIVIENIVWFSDGTSPATEFEKKIQSTAIFTAFSSQAMEVGNMKFVWKIKNFSSLQDETINSDVFSLGPCKWKLFAYPKDEDADNGLSVFLEVPDSESLPSGWSQNAKFSFTLMNQIDEKSSLTKSEDKVHEFGVGNSWGYYPFISRKELLDLKKGYLVDDTCIIKVDVTMYGDDYFESHGSSKVIKKVDATESATEEDMDAFIGDWQTVTSANKVVSFKEEAVLKEDIKYEMG